MNNLWRPDLHRRRDLGALLRQDRGAHPGQAFALWLQNQEDNPARQPGRGPHHRLQHHPRVRPHLAGLPRAAHQGLEEVQGQDPAIALPARQDHRLQPRILLQEVPGLRLRRVHRRPAEAGGPVHRITQMRFRVKPGMTTKGARNDYRRGRNDCRRGRNDCREPGMTF